MSECNECKLVAMGKGRPAMCYDCLENRNVELEQQLAALQAALSVSHIARAVFRALPPPGALPDDWDSGAEIGTNNAERVRYTMAASKILESLLQERR